MLDIDIDIDGLKQVESVLLELGKEVGAKAATGILTMSLRAGAELFENYMIKAAPESNYARLVKTKKGAKVEVRPGFLKSRISVKASTNTKGKQTRKFGKNVVSVVTVGPRRVPYVVAVEYGTRRTRANPFIRNTFSKHKNSAIHTVNQALTKKISAAQRKIAKKYQRQ